MLVTVAAAPSSNEPVHERLLGALGMAATPLALAVLCWRFLGPVRVASLNAAIEREGPEAPREIGEEEE